MSTQGGNRLALVLAVTSTILAIAGLLLLALTPDDPPQGGWGFRGFPAIFFLGSTGVGWLIMVRRQENRIGLALAVVGLLNAGQLFLTEYAALAGRTGLPAANLAGWVNSFIWVPTLALMAGGVPLLFPDGALPSRRWRPVAWLMVGGVAAEIGIIAVYPNALDTPRFVTPPFRLPVPDATLNAFAYVALVAVGISIIASGVSLLLRWRRASGVVREQLKWLALSAAFVIVTMWLAIVQDPLAVAIFIVAIGSVPIAVGIAILRYRLYEIDTVISRTLVFGLLTALLTGLFAALQKLFQSIFVGVTGNESDAAIVITTLVLAAGFAPMKSGLERLVARRFAGNLTPTKVAEPAAAAGGIASLVNPAELESLLRRVVREELAAAGFSAVQPGTEQEG